MKHTDKKDKLAVPTSELRIIGGQNRRRKVRFLAYPDVRPTPDRVRESLFNWLQGEIAGRRCLDLYCGSGILSFEALSRGAASAVSIDRNPSIIACILEESKRLLVANLTPVCAELPGYLRAGQDSSSPYNIVFIDPPYGQHACAEVFELLARGHWLAPRAHIYFEADQAFAPTDLPDSWELLKAQRAGKVYYHLVAKR